MVAFKPSTLAAALAAVTFGISASADDKQHKFRTQLSSYNEVHFAGGPPATLVGAISSRASGSFRAEIDDRRDIIHYELTYRDLETPVTQAHIHFGQKHTVGGIVVWLCQTAGTPAPAAVAALTPQCEGPNSDTVRGTITPAQVLAQAAQGIEAGNFEELVRAIRAGATYVNVHSETFRPGEIRGQLDGRGGHDHD